MSLNPHFLVVEIYWMAWSLQMKSYRRPRQKNKECLNFKADFEKAYNLIRWSLLYFMLFRCGFLLKMDIMDERLCGVIYHVSFGEWEPY